MAVKTTADFLNMTPKKFRLFDRASLASLAAVGRRGAIQLMKSALLLLAIVGMLGSRMSGFGQMIPGMPGENAPQSPTPSRPSPPSKTIPTEKVIDWQHWQSAENYRYRIGSRLAGDWERYLELELTAPLVSLGFAGIHYGEARANDVVLSPDNHSIQIKLVYGPVAKWSWNVTTYPITQKQP
jgi:hypothetical protein